MIEQLVEEGVLEVVTGDVKNLTFNGVYIGDLLSFVMSHAHKGDIWLTVQTHLNVLAIATLIELAAIIVVEDVSIDEETIKKAEEEHLVLLKTKLTAYQLAIYLHG
jgi:hypothetical protein